MRGSWRRQQRSLESEREVSAQALRGLREDLGRAEAIVERLAKVIEHEQAERAKVVMDLPALPARRVN